MALVKEETKALLDSQGVEVFKGVQKLELKRIESRTSTRTNETYYVLHFDMCVKFDAENWRNNRFLMIPLYCPIELFYSTFKGLRPSQCTGKKYEIEVEFTPNVRTSTSGQRFVNFNAEIKSIVWLDKKPEKLQNVEMDNVPF